MKGLHVIAWILLVVGGLNWGLYALTGWEVGSLFGGMDAGISKLIYVLVGLAAVYELFTHKKGCKACGSGSSM
ncbi:MAG: hypothetical protein G01um101417_160 [Parcubacteria group bacterium Gr01-1014_17]|nr:MAG: hypothetical protein G01um101417_160 [Parcubacteria group bacterium Gr01-1014_17]